MPEKVKPSGDAEGDFFESVAGVLRDRGVSLEEGLSSSEIAVLESTYELCFPPDLKMFLQCWLPRGEGFPDWRGPQAAIWKMISWPAESICFDIERNGFWFAPWGPRPEEMMEALATARAALENVPRLVPIYQHRYIPSEPQVAGNPVLSVYQTDIIHYGSDLPGYFHTEFRVPLPSWSRATPRPIRFWDDLIQINAARD